MKIAVETNDGVQLGNPFELNKFYIFDIEGPEIKKTEMRNPQKDNQDYRKEGLTKRYQNILKDCCAVISRGMDRSEISGLKDKGIDVFITFKSSTKDALNFYLTKNMGTHI